MNAVKTFRKLYREAEAKRRMYGMSNEDGTMADSFRKGLVGRTDEDEDETEDLNGTSPMRADEDEDEDEALGDSMRDDDLPREDEDEAEDEGEDESERSIKTRCARCGERATVLAPRGMKYLSEDEDEGQAIKKPKLRWKCSSCEASNLITPKRYKLAKVTKTDESAAMSFRRGYARRMGVSDGGDDPRDDEAAARFLEAYSWRKACEAYPR